MTTEKSIEHTLSIPLTVLADIAKKYSIEPGTRHYFRAGHPSGLGGIYVYFPNSLGRLLKSHNNKV